MKIKMEYFEKINCPICKCKKFEIIKKNVHKKKLNLDEIKKIYLSSSAQKLLDQLVKCSKCDFHYLNPRIRSSIIIDSYKMNPDLEFVKYNKYRLKTFQLNMNRIKRILKIKSFNNFDILDVGCGGGTFLLAAKKLKANAEGIEPNKWLVQFIKNKYKYKIKSGTLDTIKHKKRFDLITFWDVFEHMTDLNKTLKICKKLLKKNGILLLNIPDHGSIFRKILQFNWPFYLNVHLYYFEKNNVIKLLDKHKFKFIIDLIHLQILPIKYILFRSANYFRIFYYINKLIPKKFNFGIMYNVGQRIYLFKK